LIELATQDTRHTPRRRAITYFRSSTRNSRVQTHHTAAERKLTGFDNYAWSVAFSPDSNLLAAGGADDTIRIWNIANPRQPHLIADPLDGPTHYIFGLAFSPDGNTLAAAGGDGTVWTWTLAPSTPLRLTTILHAADPAGSTYTLAFSPDGNTLAAAGTAAQVVLWNASADTAAAAVCASGGDQLTPGVGTVCAAFPYQNSCTRH
jgi:WD40 repeat protein